MESEKIKYESKYSEIQLLGRGNYGSAYVVKSKVSGKELVAKKMQLDGLSEKEIQSTQGEVDILKKFSSHNDDYPFIVRYFESFSFQNTLIIIMEFCENGDLATFIKNAKRKGDFIDEKVILSWFIMLVWGVKCLHSKNVLHRDLKAANVFLTKHRFVKIGDFGISKILNTTSAKTFVGTPYYLSPEICSNQPYEFSSDIWALGCILYEMCTLKYPFEANNILNLALKITSEDIKPIPSHYSKELSQITEGLLTKDARKRFTLDQILNHPYISNFIQVDGHNIEKILQKITLKLASKPENKHPTIKKQDISQNEDTMKTIQSNFQNTRNQADTLNLSLTNQSESLQLSLTEMSPAQRAKQRKLEESDKKARQIASHMKKDAEATNFAKTKKREQFGGSGTNFGASNAAKKLEKKFQNENREKFQIKQEKRGLNAVQPINLEPLAQLTQRARQLGVTNSHDQKIVPALEKTLKKNPQCRIYTEPVTEAIHEEEDLQEYYDDDFEEYIPEEITQSEIQELEAVTVFMSVIKGDQTVSPSKRQKVQKAFQKTTIKPQLKEDKIQKLAEKCVKIVGDQRFKVLYGIVSDCYKNNIFQESEQLQQIKTNASPTVHKVLQMIEEIKLCQIA